MNEELKSKVIGVDISIERTTLAIVDIRGNILAEDYFVTSDYQNINEYVSELSDRLYMLMENNGGYEKIRSIGISAPSASSITGCISNAANLPWKGEIPFAALVRDRMGMAVAVGNDAHVSALGEYTYGSAHGLKDFMIVSLGVGVGSCIFSQGREHIGTEGYAGEFGHCCFIDGGRECGCGNRGCLEAYVGANGIVVTARELLEESDKPSLMRQAEKPLRLLKGLAARHVFLLSHYVTIADTVCEEILNHEIRYYNRSGWTLDRKRKILILERFCYLLVLTSRRLPSSLRISQKCLMACI